MLRFHPPHIHRIVDAVIRPRPQENAGFKLLMKLGYKGGGLGKDGAGAANPLMPEMKQGRAG